MQELKSFKQKDIPQVPIYYTNPSSTATTTRVKDIDGESEYAIVVERDKTPPTFEKIVLPPPDPLTFGAVEVVMEFAERNFVEIPFVSIKIQTKKFSLMLPVFDATDEGLIDQTIGWINELTRTSFRAILFTRNEDLIGKPFELTYEAWGYYE